jgi:hypothetical protein
VDSCFSSIFCKLCNWSTFDHDTCICIRKDVY